MKKEHKRSPLTEEPLRLPGEYLQNKLDELVDEQFFPVLAVSVAIIGFTMLEWVYYLLGTSRQLHPWVFTILTAVVCVGAFLYLQKIKKKLSNYRLGYKGEVVVGQLLEGLRVKGFIPIHDVPCENNGKHFNIDHVLVGPKGIFSIETKTWRKNNDLNERIGYLRGYLFAGVNFRHKNSIVQAKINAKWMENLFLRQIGQYVSVQPVLLFPGWFVEQSATNAVKKEHGVLILNPKALDVFLDQYTDVLNQEEIQRFATIISAYVHEKAIKEE